MLRTRFVVGILLCLSTSVLIGQTAKTKAKGVVEATAKSKYSMPDADTSALRNYSHALLEDRLFLGGVPPASCAEWATQSPPAYPATAKCKELGGKSCCGRCNNPSYDIGPDAGTVGINKPFVVHLRIRHLGAGDYVIYNFGKIDWGDNSQQDVFPIGQDQQLTHTYNSANHFTIHVMGGSQYKYQGDGSCSYECCTDNSIGVTVTP
jgi:hypothetical protein